MSLFSVQQATDAEGRALLDEPLRGEPKVGALEGVRVVKFKAGPQQCLLAYRFHSKPNVVEVLDVGVHEDFYRGLQGYLDAKR